MLRATITGPLAGVEPDPPDVELHPVGPNLFAVRQPDEESWTPVLFYSRPDGARYLFLTRATPRSADRNPDATSTPACHAPRVLIRQETLEDIGGIAAVQLHAFASPERPEPPEPALVAALRAGDAWIPELSLVAVRDSHVVGHVCLTRGYVDDLPVVGLGPIGVLPDHQGRGVGSALVHASLAAADARHEPLVVLLGSTHYYPRFGFVPAASVGIEPDVADWVTHLQVRTLAGWQPTMTGTFRYPKPFYDV